METVEGTISRIMFSSEDTGYKVLKIRTRTGSPTIVTGEFGPEIICATAAIFHGDFRQHPKYGMQFRAFSYDITYDAEKTASVRLFIDAIAPNIGPERADAIVNHFGPKTIDVLDQTPNRLLEVAGIGKVSAESLAASWTQNRETWNKEREIYSLRAFLNSLGIKERRVKKIMAKFGGGTEAEETIRENPYVLTDVEGFGFTTTDYIAKKLGIPDSSPERLKAFIHHILSRTCPDNGHLFLLKGSITALSNKYCMENSTRFLDKETLDWEDTQPLLQKLTDDGKVIIDDNKIYAKNNFMFENRSAQMLVNIMYQPSDLIFLNRQTIDKHIEVFEKENSLKLSEEQRQALYYFAEQKVFVITGPPGTGKTTILKAVVELAIRQNLHLTCMTPTGISAKKLAMTIQYDAYTIHRRLGFRGNQWICNEANPYDTDIAIIDESSMIDQEVFYRLMAALKSRTHIIFVGDQDQLPSVSAGNVLKELINSGEVPTVRLETIFRQEEASDIIKVAHQVRNGDTNLELFKPDPKADVFFMRMKDPAEIEKIIVALAQKFKDKRRLFQIITPRNEGPLSVASLNETLQNILNPPDQRLKEINCGPFLIRVGDRVIVRKNDYELEVFNGDIGKVIDISGGHIGIDIDNRMVAIKLDLVAEKIRLAYAITIHKCVSNECLVFCPDGMKKMGQIQNNSAAITKKGNAEKIVDRYETFLEETILETRCGFTISVSSDHPLLIGDEEGDRWVQTDSIKKGHYACISRKIIEGKPINNSFQNRTGLFNSKHNRQYHRIPIKLPEYVTTDLSWMLGALVGDGCYTSKKDGTVEFICPKSPYLMEKMRHIWINLNLNVSEHKKKGRLHSIYTTSLNFRSWLEEIGLDYVKAPKKKSPEMIFEATIPNRSAYIRGLFDTDGGVDNSLQMRFTTSSEKLAHQIHLLLLSLGIISSCKLQSKKHFKVTVSGKDTCLFFHKINFEEPFKKDKLAVIIGRLRKKEWKTNKDKVPYGKKIANTLWGVIKKKDAKGKGLFTQSFRKIACRLSLVRNGRSMMSRYLLNSAIKHAKNQGVIVPPWIKKHAERDFFYDPITKIEYNNQKIEMSDIKVERDHSFICNGFVCHNSQGLEYPYIILPFINQHGKKLLQRNLLYTAVTRAREKVIVLGHGSALERAINNASVSKRNTILGERICQCSQRRRNPSSPPSLEAQHSSQNMETEQSSSKKGEFFPMVIPEK